MSAAPTRDLYAAITAQIVAAIEAGAGDFHMPWHRSGGSVIRPWNVASGKRYRGINIVSLWISAEAQAYPHPIWGTYQQWQSKGAQVRRGEKSSLVVFYKDLSFEARDEQTGEAALTPVRMARASHVFNASQVDGYTPPETPTVAAATIDPIEAADTVLRRSGAEIREGGDKAYYAPGLDVVMLPERTRFVGSPTRSATESWYGVALHELTHWSGGAKRLNRDLKGRFGDNAYAMEELIAELGSSYLCADLGVTIALRPDHAAYIQDWLTVLQSDKRAIFTAAARAQEAAAYLIAFAPAPFRPDAAMDESNIDTASEGNAAAIRAGPEPL